MNGIDVSKWQGTIDWNKVKAAGIDFAIIRAGYGSSASQKDTYFEKNYSGAKAAGIPVGAYWYSYAASVAAAEQEAQAFLSVIKGKQFELPIYFDQEYEPSIVALSNAQRTEIVKTVLKTLEAAGYYAALYASTDWINNRLNYKELSAFDVWAAQYGSKCTCKAAFNMWQFTSNGSVSGINGNVDMNIAYREYPTIIKNAGLNGYSKNAAQPVDLYDVTIKGANAGDMKTLTAQAEKLGLACMVTKL